MTKVAACKERVFSYKSMDANLDPRGWVGRNNVEDL